MFSSLQRHENSSEFGQNVNFLKMARERSDIRVTESKAFHLLRLDGETPSSSSSTSCSLKYRYLLCPGLSIHRQEER